ncbi:MAG: flagellar hook-length control protein FliK [Alphaproteobacteria bacterium]|nr:flagellar hook-length control protein FliK [Alphaproteobacteria bacterium]
MPSVREIPVHIAKSVRDGHADLTLALRPPELGHLTIRLHFADGHLQVDVRADRPETLHLLQREADHFERSLRQAGLDVRDGGLQFSAQGDGGRQRPTGGGGAGWQGNWALSADGHPDSNANASGRAGGSPPLSVWLAGDDRLDLRL